jgi:methionyl-tRNA formyltransferase
MKIVFMGTPEFAVPSLKVLLDNNYDVGAVVTVPDKKKGRGLSVSISAIKKIALEKGLKVLQPENLRDSEFTNELRSLKPALIVVVAFRILPKEIFSIPEYGSFNLHASLLPQYRGAAPVNRAIINGETETGVTTFFLKEKVDTGNIILQEKIGIQPDENAGSLHDRLSVLGARVVLETVRLIEKGDISTSLQDNNLASLAPKIFKEDCNINWNQKASGIHNFIRGLSPNPGAFTYLGNKLVKIFRSALTNLSSEKFPGYISVKDKSMYVSCLDYQIEILEIQSEGRKRINASEFLNGIDKDRDLFFESKVLFK